CVHELINKDRYQPDGVINEPVASVLVNGGIIGPVRMLFDCGREFELIGRYCYSVRRSFDLCGDTTVSERNSELGYSLDLSFEFVKNGDKRVANTLCSGNYFCHGFDLARTLFDRGKMFEWIRICSHYNSNIFRFSFGTLIMGLLVLNEFILKRSFSANFISEPHSELG
ncbi:hypothetical protein MKW92_038547, partial [Papaver armeniacum]